MSDLLHEINEVIFFTNQPILVILLKAILTVSDSFIVKDVHSLRKYEFTNFKRLILVYSDFYNFDLTDFFFITLFHLNHC